MIHGGARRPADGTPALVGRTFLLLSAASLVFFIAGGVVLPVVAPFALGPLAGDELGSGIAFGAFAVASLVVRPVVGWAADRFGRRPLLVGGGLVTAAALVLHLFVDSLPLFVVARAVLGIGEAFFFIAVLAAGADIAPPRRRGEALNLLSLSLYLGLAIGPLVGETVRSVAGFQAVWLASLGLAVLATALSALVPETSPTVVDPSVGRARGRLVHPAGLFPGVLILLGTWGMAGFLAFISEHARVVGMGGGGIPLAIYSLVVVGLRIAFASLPDRLGGERLAAGALGVGAVGLAIIGFVLTPAGVLIGTIVLAAGVAFLVPSLLTVAVSRVHDTERGTVVGTTGAFLDVSFGVAPAMLGAVAGAGGYGAAMLVGAAASALGLGLLLMRHGALTQPAT